MYSDTFACYVNILEVKVHVLSGVVKVLHSYLLTTNKFSLIKENNLSLETFQTPFQYLALKSIVYCYGKISTHQLKVTNK